MSAAPRTPPPAALYSRALPTSSRSTSFDREVDTGHGRYVCGEDPSLLRSIEGQRPEGLAPPPPEGEIPNRAKSN